MSVPRPRWWALVSATAAPVLLIGGWTVAQARRDDGFDAVRQTISSLAAEGAPHRWIMTLGLAGLGVAHVVTAAGLPVRSLARVVLAAAGVATIGVALFPLSTTGDSVAHGVAATTAFVLLALWPATTARRRTSWVLHPAVAIGVTVVSALLLLGFATRSGGATRGAWERGVAAQQALWPLVVVVALRTGARMRA